MRLIYSGTLFVLSFVCLQQFAAAQGYVGIGTTTPAEKLDVNGAIIVRGDATMAIPVPGTIRWNAADGMHDGYMSSAEWRRLENDMSLLTGDFYTINCGAPLTASIGGGVSTSIGAYDTPFGTQYSDGRRQFLYSAAELTGAGFCAGDITAIGFNIITLGTSTINNFTIKMKNTATTAFIAPPTVGYNVWETGTTTVFPSATVNLVVGLNTFTFATPFTWDGTSNIIIDICFNNGTTGYTGTNSSVNTLNTGITKNKYYTLTTILDGCTVALATSAAIARPNVMITGTTTGPTPTSSNYIYSAQPWVVGAPTLPAPYLHHGPGSITAQALYDDNVLLSDYVFDAYFDGEVSAADRSLHGDYKMAEIDEMIRFVEQNRHLPTIKGRRDWEKNGKFSVGELTTYLWETTETQALYIIELKKRIDVLKSKSESLDTK